MTVGELIETLQRYPSETEVCHWDAVNEIEDDILDVRSTGIVASPGDCRVVIR